MSRKKVLQLVVLLAVFSVAALGQQTRSRVVTRAEPEGLPQNLRLFPAELVNGSPFIIYYLPEKPLKSLSADWEGHQIPLHKDENSDAWLSLAGVNYDTAPGVYLMGLKGVTAAGGRISASLELRVNKGRYPTTAISVPPKYVDPDPRDLERINQEKALKAATFGASAEEALWKGAFSAPASSPVSGEFGSQRTYNGKRQSVHQGLDFAAPTGTPVRAVNFGKVVLAKEMYFEGNFIVVDHGQGLYSLYLHLSEFKVKAGERVEKGQLLGLSGGTGRATGPHLHLAIRWQGEYLNPLTLLRIKLPDQPALR